MNKDNESESYGFGILNEAQAIEIGKNVRISNICTLWYDFSYEEWVEVGKVLKAFRERKLSSELAEPWLGSYTLRLIAQSGGSR